MTGGGKFIDVPTQTHSSTVKGKDYVFQTETIGFQIGDRVGGNADIIEPHYVGSRSTGHCYLSWLTTR